MSVHVYPVREQEQHDLENTDCRCDPYVEWINDDTGLPYENGPLVVHEAFSDKVRAEVSLSLKVG
jgi:hypothetical protein